MVANLKRETQGGEHGDRAAARGAFTRAVHAGQTRGVSTRTANKRSRKPAIYR